MGYLCCITFQPASTEVPEVVVEEKDEEVPEIIVEQPPPNLERKYWLSNTNIGHRMNL